MKKTRQFLSQFTRVFLIILIPILLIGQFYYWLGLGLHFSRWWLVSFGLLFSYWGWKKYFKSSRVLLIFSILLIGEWAIHRVQYASLDRVEAPSQSLKILSYNVFFKNGYPKPILNIIQQQKPDVLLVQELTPQWHQRIVQQFGKRYPYRAVKARKGTHGIGIYSKYPLQQPRYLNNSSNLPIAQTAILHHQNNTIQLTNIHLASPSRAVEHPERFFSHMEANADLRVKQWEKLLQFVGSGTTVPQLIIGDANTLPYEPLYRTMRKSFVDLHSTEGQFFGWTFPNTASIPFPFLRLDYAFAKGALVAKNMEVIKGGSSDHLAIVVELEW